jgi:hypothetical protein
MCFFAICKLIVKFLDVCLQLINKGMSKLKITIFLFSIAMIFTCKSSLETVSVVDTKARQLRPYEAKSFHKPVIIRIGWFPYTDLTIHRKENDDWVVVKQEKEEKGGSVPVIMLEYPESADTMWLDMNTDNELLGRLLKHTLMTEEPIRRPYTEFFEVASCSKCHPGHVDKGF